MAALPGDSGIIRPRERTIGRKRAGTPRAGQPLEISLTTFEPMTPELVQQAEKAGIDRLIVYPLVGGEELERTVRDIGARFARR